MRVSSTIAIEMPGFHTCLRLIGVQSECVLISEGSKMVNKSHCSHYDICHYHFPRPHECSHSWPSVCPSSQSPTGKGLSNEGAAGCPCGLRSCYHLSWPEFSQKEEQEGCLEVTSESRNDGTVGKIHGMGENQ